MKYDVVVTDSNQRIALEIIRCLGREGVKVCGVEKKIYKKPIGFYSRFCKEKHYVDSYEEDKFLDICSRAECVIPVSINTIYSVQKMENLKEKTLLPELELLRKINDKYEVINIAKESGIFYPTAEIVSSKDTGLPSEPLCGYPAVLKLRNDEDLYLYPTERYRIIRNKTELMGAYSELKVHGKDMILEEYIEGKSYGYSGLFKNGELIAGLGHKRLREYPVQGGPSSYCMSVRDEDLEYSAKRILCHIKWSGPAMVEFKKDKADGKFKIIEINPRYWGSIPLARVSGINIPFLHYCLVAGKSYTNMSLDFKSGVRLKFRFMDIVAWLQYYKTCRSKLTSLTKYVIENFNPTIYDGIISLTDPVPCIVYLIQKVLK